VKLLSLAKNEAEITQAHLVGSEHLLLALAVENGRTGKLLSKFGVTYAIVRAKTAGGWPSIYSVVATPPYSPTLVRILDRARLIAKQFHDKWVQPEHLLLSVLEQGTGFAYSVLELIGLPRDEVRDAMKKQLPKLRQERLWKRKG
jgi:ATP-dependent Clp protease ATP-binding subunit ClpC